MHIPPSIHPPSLLPFFLPHSSKRVNGTLACENEEVLRRDLKGLMGFKGFVVSDWYATPSTAASVRNGLDMEMPIAK